MCRAAWEFSRAFESHTWIPQEACHLLNGYAIRKPGRSRETGTEEVKYRRACLGLASAALTAARSPGGPTKAWGQV
jgi:hypothetical protein